VGKSLFQKAVSEEGKFQSVERKCSHMTQKGGELLKKEYSIFIYPKIIFAALTPFLPSFVQEN